MTQLSLYETNTQMWLPYFRGTTVPYAEYTEKVRRSKTPHNMYLGMLSELFILSSVFEAGWECAVCSLAWQL